MPRYGQPRLLLRRLTENRPVASVRCASWTTELARPSPGSPTTAQTPRRTCTRSMASPATRGPCCQLGGHTAQARCRDDKQGHSSPCGSGDVLFGCHASTPYACVVGASSADDQRIFLRKLDHTGHIMTDRLVDEFAVMVAGIPGEPAEIEVAAQRGEQANDRRRQRQPRLGWLTAGTCGRMIARRTVTLGHGKLGASRLGGLGIGREFAGRCSGLGGVGGGW